MFSISSYYHDFLSLNATILNAQSCCIRKLEVSGNFARPLKLVTKRFFTKPACIFGGEKKKFGSKLSFSKIKSSFALDLNFCNKGDGELGSKCSKLSQKKKMQIS